MALALLGRRQGRLLARALALAETHIGCGALGRCFPDEDTDIDASICSTSHKHVAYGSIWQRGAQARSYAINNKPTIRYVPVPEPEHDDFSREPTTYTQLLSAIRNTKNIKRMQHLISTYTDRLDAVHVAAAVARLPRLVRYRSHDLVDRSDTVVMPTPGLPRVRRKHGAKPKASHLEEGARVAAQLDALVALKVEHFFPRQAACSIWAFGELRRQGVVSHMASLQDVLLSVTKGDLEPLRVHGHGVDFAQLVQGLAKLGHNDPALMGRLLPLLQERLGSMLQRELQMSAWGLASLGYGDPKVFQAIADQLLRTGTAFLLPSGVSSLFWAYAKVGVQRVDLFNGLARCMLGQAVLLAPQDVATTLWACNKLGYHNAQLFGVLGDSMLRNIDTCSDLEVSSALDALAGLGYHHVPLFDAVEARILKEPVIGADPVSIARVLAAYGKLGRREPPDLELAAKLAAAFVPRLPIVREDVLAMACEGLWAFGYCDQEVLSAYASRAEFLLPSCSDKQLFRILQLLGSASYPHYQLAVACARHLQTSIISSGKYRSLAMVIDVLYLCARQGVEDPAAADEVLALAASQEGQLRTADAAKLIVIGQVMNKQEPLLTHLADVLVQNAGSLDARLAEAALQSARVTGHGKLAEVLSAQLQSSFRQNRAVAAAGL